MGKDAGVDPPEGRPPAVLKLLRRPGLDGPRSPSSRLNRGGARLSWRPGCGDSGDDGDPALERNQDSGINCRRQGYQNGHAGVLPHGKNFSHIILFTCN